MKTISNHPDIELYFDFDKRLTGCPFSLWVWLTDDWPMVIHHCLPFADERRSVKCLGSAAGVSFPSPPLPPAPTFLPFFSQCPRALAPLGLKETETTATQATNLVSTRTIYFWAGLLAHALDRETRPLKAHVHFSEKGSSCVLHVN